MLGWRRGRWWGNVRWRGCEWCSSWLSDDTEARIYCACTRWRGKSSRQRIRKGRPSRTSGTHTWWRISGNQYRTLCSRVPKVRRRPNPRTRFRWSASWPFSLTFVHRQTDQQTKYGQELSWCWELAQRQRLFWLYIVQLFELFSTINNSVRYEIEKKI